MNHYSKIFLLIITVATISGCGILNGDKPSDKLIGMWEGPGIAAQSGIENTVIVYGFWDKENYTRSEQVMDSAGYRVGYLNFESGTYRLYGNQLTLNPKERYRSNHNTIYPTVEELITAESKEDPPLEQYNVKFENEGTTEFVTLYPDCPINALCASYKLENQHVIFN